MTDQIRALIDAVSQLCPLGGNGFADHTLWRILRQHSYHRDAEALTKVTNAIRAATRAVLDSEATMPCPRTGGALDEDGQRRAWLLNQIETIDRDTLRDVFPALDRLLRDRDRD
jgi:hypothetical protein